MWTASSLAPARASRRSRWRTPPGNFVKVVQRVPVKIVIDSGLDPNIPLPLGLSVEPTVHLK